MTNGLAELHVHSCTIQKAATSTSTDPYHPGSTTTSLSFSPAASETTVNCRFQVLDRLMVEMEGTGGGRSNQIVSQTFIYIAFAEIPASLVDYDSQPGPETLHRIVNVKGSDGAIMDAGPFDIERIIDMGGASDILKLAVKRVR